MLVVLGLCGAVLGYLLREGRTWWFGWATVVGGFGLLAVAGLRPTLDTAYVPVYSDSMQLSPKDCTRSIVARGPYLDPVCNVQDLSGVSTMRIVSDAHSAGVMFASNGHGITVEVSNEGVVAIVEQRTSTRRYLVRDRDETVKPGSTLALHVKHDGKKATLERVEWGHVVMLADIELPAGATVCLWSEAGNTTWENMRL